MILKKLQINNLRCFEQLNVDIGTKNTVIVGGNGSGKTTILEAFSMVCLGKSFISNRSSDIIRKGTEGSSVRAEGLTEKKDLLTIQMRKRKASTEIFLNGLPIQKASDLARTAPAVVIPSHAATLLTEAPDKRRALVDRTMFHVEPEYIEYWKNYRKALRQRNQIIRGRNLKKIHRAWNDQLIFYGEEIDKRRQELVFRLNNELKSNEVSNFFGELHFKYSPGWERKKGYRLCLGESWEKDERLGYTTVGIHRADLSLCDKSGPIVRKLSGGQSKFLVYCVLLGLAKYIIEKTDKKPLILVDDITAELDDIFVSSIVEMLLQQEGQVVLTAIRTNELLGFSENAESIMQLQKNNH